MTKIELICAIMREFNNCNLLPSTSYGINVEWSKTLHIASICNYAISGIMVAIYDDNGHYVCEKKVTEKFPKQVLQQIFDELTK